MVNWIGLDWIRTKDTDRSKGSTITDSWHYKRIVSDGGIAMIVEVSVSDEQ
jgi:hypothetical protein